MKKIRFGIVGVGGMGGKHALNTLLLEECEVAAVADVNRK
jgi:predicted dehydrogenase